MTEKLNVKMIYGIDSWKYLGNPLYYNKIHNVTYSSSNDYHPECCTCAYLFNCPYNCSRDKSKYAKDTQCMRYVFYNSFNLNLVYVKYHNDNSRRKYVLMVSGIPYKYDERLE